MDVPRKDVRRRKIVRWTAFIVIAAALISGTLYGVSRLKPAAPGVDMSALWPDTVKRGSMLREVHGLGTLVPEETMLIPATTDGRVESIPIKPGTPVKADSIVMVLTNPDLETAAQDAQFALKAGEADYDNLKVTLAKALLDMKSTAAQVSADYNTAKLKADRDTSLAKESLLSAVDAKISEVTAEELAKRNDIEQQRLDINGAAEEAQLAAQRVKVEQLRADYNLKKSQVEQLKVRAGFDGMLQQLPSPLTPVEERAIGPSLGQDNIDKGRNAMVYGMLAAFIFMAIYYKLFGVIADVVLLANVVLLLALLSLVGAALTLPGIAAVVLTVGMAVDANILIYERIREELRNGVSPRAAISAGFDRAFSAIFDSNITAAIAGLVLWLFGAGAVRGFAVVLVLGIATSMFTSLMGSRALVQIIYGGKRKVERLSI